MSEVVWRVETSAGGTHARHVWLTQTREEALSRAVETIPSSWVKAYCREVLTPEQAEAAMQAWERRNEDPERFLDLFWNQGSARKGQQYSQPYGAEGGRQWGETTHVHHRLRIEPMQIEPRKVYALFLDHGWEGLDFLGAFATLEGAQAEAEDGSPIDEPTDPAWERDEVHGRKGPWERMLGGTQYRIAEITVQT